MQWLPIGYFPRGLQQTGNEPQADCEEVQSFDKIPDDVNDQTRYIGLVLSIITCLYVPLCAIYFFMRRREHPMLYQRKFTLMLGLAAGVLVYAVQVPFRDFYGPKDFPCDVYALTAFLSFFLIVFPALLRLMSLYHRITFNQAVINLTFDSLKTGKAKILLDELQWVEDHSELNHSVNRRVPNEALRKLDNAIPGDGTEKNSKRKLGCFDILKQILAFPALVSVRALDNLGKFMAPFLYCISCWRHPRDVPRPLRLRYFFASTTSSHLLLLTFFLVCGTTFGVYYAFVFEPFKGCTGCGTDKLNIVMLPFVGFATLMGFGLVSALWEYPDNLGIKKESLHLLLMFTSTYVILVPLLNALTGTPEETGEGNWSNLNLLALLVVVTYIFPYQVYLARKKIGSHEQRKSSLHEILDTDDGSKAFAVHLATELSLENLYFYKSALAWKEKYPSRTDEENSEQAKELYDVYFAPGATFRVNVGAKDRTEVERRISEDTCTIDVFDQSINEVLRMMAADTFFRFRKSTYYKAYYNDLSLVESLL